MTILVKVWQWLITLYQHQGRLDKTIKVANKALERIKDKTSAGYCDILRRRGFVYYLKGDVEQFLSDVNSALEIAKQNNYELEKAGCLGVLGIYHQERHNFEKALECYQQAIEIKRKLGDKEGVVKLLINLGTPYKGMNRFDESKRLFDEALQTTKEKRLKINCHLEIGRLFHVQGDISKAKKEIELALKLALSTKFANEQGDCYRELARIAYEEDRKDESQKFYQKALKIYDSHGYSAKARALMREEIAKRF
ncbi:MAG: tetratricopeptide repeat protein [Patescibacteria group bacterium]